MLKSIWDELEDMNRKFDETFAFWPAFPFRRQAGSLPMPPALAERPFVPFTEVFAEDADLVVRVELPGIDAEKDVTVSLADGELVIKGERKFEKPTAEKTYYRFETFYGKFERHFAVPETLEAKAIHATYKDGILEVVVKDAIEHAEARTLKAKTIPIVVPKATPELVAKA